MSETVLLVDRDVETLRVLGAHLEQAGMEVARELDAESAAEAIQKLTPDAAVVEYSILAEGGDGLIEALHGHGVTLVAVLEENDPPVVAQALRAGADRVLVRPLDPDRLGLEVARASEMGRCRRMNAAFGEAAWKGVDLLSLGHSALMREVAKEVSSVAESDRTSVLITGESGVGKRRIAWLIHRIGPRAGRPFLECSTVGADPSQLEIQLVGAERWARAGVDARIRGLMETAAGGSLLIREIGGLPPELQPALLRSLEVRTFRRVDGDRDIAAEARLITTSAKDLAAEVDADRFSGELLYRLNALVLHVPSVRERSPNDRTALLQSIHTELTSRMSVILPIMSPEALERLVEYEWPGNVREMQHVLERAAFMAQGQPAILVEHLPGELRARPGLGDRRHNPVSLEEVEKRQIESALQYHGGNRTRAAKELRISRATLINKIKRYALTQ